MMVIVIRIEVGMIENGIQEFNTHSYYNRYKRHMTQKFLLHYVKELLKLLYFFMLFFVSQCFVDWIFHNKSYPCPE